MGVNLWGVSPLYEIGSLKEAILQVLTPISDPDFSESSFGFRPKRSAHGAIKQVQRYIKQGFRYCVDMDLSKCFDRIQHDVLMSRVARKVRDKRLLRLIGRYLRAGVMVNGLVQDVGWSYGNDQTVAVGPGTCVSQISLERACSSATNRLVRTRMLGGVGAGRGNPPGYPIWRTRH
jgi:hypothetical protein